MNISQLEKLSKNPHYKLSPKQLAELEAYQNRMIKHDYTVKKHNPNVVKHNPKLEGEDGN